MYEHTYRNKLPEHPLHTKSNKGSKIRLLSRDMYLATEFNVVLSVGKRKDPTHVSTIKNHRHFPIQKYSLPIFIFDRASYEFLLFIIWFGKSDRTQLIIRSRWYLIILSGATYSVSEYHNKTLKGLYSVFSVSDHLDIH